MKERSRLWTLIPLLVATLGFSLLLLGQITFRNLVYITDGNRRMVLTQLDEPEAILAERGITLGAYDVYTFAEHPERDRTYELVIERAYDVTLTDGSAQPVQIPVRHETVAAVLERAGLTLGEYDEVTPALDVVLEEGDSITITRITYGTVSETEALPHETEYRATPLLKDGRTRVLTEGTDGQITRTFEEKWVNGALEYRVQLSETISAPSQTEVILVGDSSASVSTLEQPDWLALDENGNPVSYSQVFTGKATGYSARAGAKTASGRYAVVGHVAVNPNLIPYGSKLYIKSADNSFVYGYAIAADTGIALMDGRVLVDLFYGSYLESCLNGAKQLQVYVLE